MVEYKKIGKIKPIPTTYRTVKIKMDHWQIEKTEDRCSEYRFRDGIK